MIHLVGRWKKYRSVARKRKGTWGLVKCSGRINDGDGWD